MRISAKSVALISCLGTVAVVSFVAGSYWKRPVNQPAWSLNGPVVHADSAVSNGSFAMATCGVDEDVEGLVTLDFLTGELQCVVPNRRTGKVTGLFKTNVTSELGVAQNAQYLMATGRMNTPGQGANSVIYVMDTTSGKFVSYGIPWRRDLASTQNMQGANLLPLDIGTARNVPIRGQ